MNFKHCSLALLLSTLYILLCPAYAILEKRSLEPPSQDPFYDCPEGIGKLLPGTIIRHRESIAPLAKYQGQPTNVKVTYQLLYRTEDSFNCPVCAVSTIVVPENADFTKMISYQAVYDSANNDCSPSYQFLKGASANTTGSVEELGFIALLLKNRWVISIPDYEGLTAAFECGYLEGHAVLDSVRAALASGPLTGIAPNATYAMWGYSGGSFSTNWASELQPTYAPELSFVGAAAGGLTPNLTSTFLTLNEQLYAGLAATAIVGLAKQYTKLSDYLDTHLVASTASAFLNAEHECFAQAGKQFAYQNLDKYFIDGSKFYTDPVVASVVNAMELGKHGPPQMPLYFYKAVHDEISPIADTDALVQTYCEEGVSVEYVRNSKGTHEQESVYGAPGAVKFLERVMDGGPAKLGCSVHNVSITLSL